jgi:hypothetical protein
MQRGWVHKDAFAAKALAQDELQRHARRAHGLLFHKQDVCARKVLGVQPQKLGYVRVDVGRRSKRRPHVHVLANVHRAQLTGDVHYRAKQTHRQDARVHG